MVLAHPIGNSASHSVGTTDDDGLVTSLLLTPGKHQILVWPKRLSSNAARRKYFEAHEDDPDAYDRALVSVTTVVAKVEPDDVIDVRLPATAGY